MSNSVLDYFVSAVYPNRCLGCDKIINQKYLCSDCAAIVVPSDEKLCFKCGCPREECICSMARYYFDGMVTCFEGDEANRKAFYSFKFYGNRSGGRFFSAEMVRRVSKLMQRESFDLVVNVPSHRTTLSERGYNVTGILARQVARGIGCKYKSVLKQPKPTPKQHHSTLRERYINVSNKYQTVRGAKLKGLNVLLVDDIKTTGATLSEAARQLKLAGAERVLAVTAITNFKRNKEQNDTSEEATSVEK